MAHVRFIVSIIHSIRRWQRPPAKTAKSERRFVMHWMTPDVFPARKSLDLTAGFGLRVAISMTTRAEYWKKLKAQQTALFSIRLFTATTHLQNRLPISFSTPPS